MIKLTKEQVSERFRRREANGDHVDSRLKRRLEKDTDFYEIILEDEDSFLSLIWQSVPKVHVVTPPGQARDLRSIANRMIGRGWTFERLSMGPPIEDGEHDPNWFIQCARISSGFDFSRFGEIAVRPINKHEEDTNPLGTFYIHDGNHKSLVLAVKILRMEIEFQPVSALLVRPSKVEEDG